MYKNKLGIVTSERGVEDLIELEQPTQSIPKGRRFCTICGEVKKETQFEGDENHCISCCEKMLHTKLHWSGFVALLFVIALVCTAVFLGVRTMPAAVSVFKARQAISEQNYGVALLQFKKAQEEINDANKSFYSEQELKDMETDKVEPDAVFTLGIRSWECYADIYASSVAAYDVSSALSENLDRELLKSNPKFLHYQEVGDAYATVRDMLYAIDEQYNGTDEVYEKMLEGLKTLCENDKSDYIAGYASYLKGNITAYYHPEDIEKAIDMYRGALKYIPFEESMISNTIITAALDNGLWDTVVEFSNRVLKLNPRSASTYVDKALAEYSAGKKDDAQKTLATMQKTLPDHSLYYKMQTMIAIREDDMDSVIAFSEAGVKANDEKAAEIFTSLLRKRSMEPEDEEFFSDYIDFATLRAVAQLLQGDNKGAFDTIYEKAFNYMYYYSSICGQNVSSADRVVMLSSLAASLVKNEDALKTIAELGYEPDETIQGIVNGELSVHDVFVKGKVGLE